MIDFDKAQRTIDDTCDAIRVTLDPISRIDGLSDDAWNVIQTALHAHSAALYEAVTKSVFDAIATAETHAEEIDRLNEQVCETLSVVREAADRLPTVFILHEDAKRFGWQDRDEEAWHIITDLHAGIAEACRPANIVA